MPDLIDPTELQGRVRSSGEGSSSARALTGIWAEVLRLPSVQLDANFFDIGGDSMTAMEVIMRTGEVLGVDLPLMAFFEDPTIAHLAEVVDELRGGEMATSSVVRIAGRREFPLSYSQQVFWLLEQQNSGTGLYNTARIFRIRGQVDAPILERSLSELVRRHEILRVRFVSTETGPVQIVETAERLPLAVSDLSALDDRSKETAARALELETIREPFNLESGPVLRARLVRLTVEDALLCIAIHHVVSDGFTGSILLEELAAIYDAFAAGKPSPLPEVELNFTDYAAWEREWMSGSRLDDEVAFWRRALSGAPTSIDMPADGEPVSETERHGRLRSTTIAAESLQPLQALAQANGTTLFTIMTAAFRILLYRWSGQKDFLIGTIAANRSRSQTERMLGCFVNPIGIRNAVEESATVLSLISREKSAVMDAFAHQDCPFTKIVEAINPERTSSDNPLFNTALLLQSFPSISVTGRHFKAEHVNFDAEVALLDLRFIATESAAGLQIDCEYSTSLFKTETIDDLLASYLDVLTQMVAGRETDVAKIEISETLTKGGAEYRKAKHRQTISVAANFTAEPIEEPLAFWMEQLRTPSRIEFAPFDQVFQQLFDPASLLASNADGFNLILIQWRDGQPAGNQARELAAALKADAARRRVPVLVCICPPAITAEDEVLAAELVGHAGIHVLYPQQVLDLYPVENYRDTYADAVGAIPYTPHFFVALASMVARRMHALKSSPYKVIALDADNTLWKGVCGEEGPLGVEVDAPRRALQEFMLAQKDAGMLLCICSKNVQADVDAVFESNPGMLLRPADIVSSRINWQSKSENLRDLARELNVGLDSFVLIDDNPLECAEVRANCPGTLVLELPVEDAGIPGVLRQMWAFDHWSVTEEDRQRSELYRQERDRERSRDGAGDLEEFLRGLELKIDIRPMEQDDLARASQLTQRTNQFNCTTRRRSEAEVVDAIANGSECLVIDVRDRFGDYGLVGLAIFAAKPDGILVDTLLLSCRVLGRKVEHNILVRLGEIAIQRGLHRVDVEFVTTAKNRPALDFLESIGSTFRIFEGESSVYRFPADYARVAHELAIAIPEAPKEQAVAKAVQSLAVPRADLEHIARDLGGVTAITRAMQSRPTKTGIATSSLTPRTATEEILSGIWAGLLRISPPGISDDFFRLGGNSLLAVQVLSRVRQAFGVEIPLRSMFEEPTLAGLASRIDKARREQTGLVTPPLLKRPHVGAVPASFAQQRLWFIDELEPENPIYNIPQMFSLRGSLNIDALQGSLSEIVRRHESLRTTFEAADGLPQQMIAAPPVVALPVTDLSDLPEEQREAEIQRLAQREAVLPFHLAHDLMLRARLLRRAPDDHVLLIVFHHISGDRWSAGILAEEMEALYSAFERGEPSPLAELPLQYADFAVWQREWLQGPELEKQAAYWRRKLSGAPALLELPTDRPRPALPSHKGATEAATLPAELVAKLTALSNGDGVTLFMTMLAALQTLLGRYSGQDDVVVGSPIAGRNYAEIEPLIGFFVNTLALRTDLSGNPTFRELLAQVKEATLDAYAHQDIPFERLVEELQPERTLNYQPVFQVMFALQNAPQSGLALADMTLERLPLHQGTSMFDVSWFATHVWDGMQIRLEYSTELFDVATMARAIGHFRHLLEAIVANPDQRLSQLPLLDEPERRLVIEEFNDTAAHYPPNLCIHDLVTLQAHKSPEGTALIDGERRISYGELNERANQIAHYLMKRGAGPDIPVGVCIERTAELVVSILGVLKAGSPYVPLDPAYPAERIAGILDDAKPPIVLTQKSLECLLASFAGETVFVDEDWAAIASEPKSDPVTAVGPANLAYILFTSGSTGRPKGVAIEHRTPATFIQWAQEVFAPEELAGILFSTSVCFDVSMFEMFVTLSAGGKVIVAENGLALPALPARGEVTLINAVPSVMSELVAAGGIPASVKTLNLAGEALPDALVDRLYASTSADKLYNLYGPTETSYATFTLVKRGSAVTIGKPLANTQCYVLDSNLNPAPIGVPGELYISGDGVAREYYGRPELTAERFVRNPFSGGPVARMYKTGDRCRWLPNGELQYFGRLDHQVKLRGFRIELGEIEATLDRHPGVERSLVVVREDEPGMPRLVAYVVGHSGNAPDIDGLQQHVRRSLPDYMAPSVIMVLDAFPLTNNGKLDRKALPAPEYSPEAEVFVEPRTAAEQKLAEIWVEVLRIPRVGAHDNFFSLGGHSLLATRVISRVRQGMGAELPLRSIFEAPTLESLAARIAASAQSSELMPIPRVPRDRPLPLSSAQERLWFLDQLDPQNAQYNFPLSLQLTGPVDFDALQAAVSGIVARHEVLRTTYHLHGDRPVQIIAPELKLALGLLDVSHLPPEFREPEARRLVIAEGQRPFDLAAGPLIRALLLRLDEQSHILLLIMNHSVTDGWSMLPVVTELSALYEAAATGEPSTLPELAIQYGDYAVWQRQWLQSEALTEQLCYWKNQLAGAPSRIELPTDRPRPAALSYRGATETIMYPLELLNALYALGKKEGTTLFMTLLAAFDVLLHRYTSQENIVVGTAVANRTRTEVENLIGLFVNTIPMHADLSGNPVFRDLLQQVRTVALGGFTNQDLPFEELVKAIAPERDLSSSPIVQVMLVLQNAQRAILRGGDVEFKGITIYNETAKLDLALFFIERPEGLSCVVEYSTDLFDATTIRRLLGHLGVLLQAIVEDPAQRIGELPLLTAAEREMMLYEWNASARDYPRDICLHRIFEQQAELAPDRVAIIGAGRVFTYGELNTRANQVAHELIGRGAGPGVLVGIRMSRTIDMWAALLGVLKSGAAYIPLDLAFPQERIDSILEDSAVLTMLSDEGWEGYDTQPKHNPDVSVASDDLAYVIYTSGSTGKPKGVQISHRSLVNLLFTMRREPGMSADDTMVAITTISFDMSVPELYLPLVSGAKIILATKEEAADPNLLLSIFHEHRPTFFEAAPVTWRMMMGAGWTGDSKLKALIGAEAVPAELVEQLLPRVGELWNMYGPTETTVWSSTYKLESAPASVAPLGRPLANTTLYVLDARMQPVPIGVSGELYIGGDGVARGYSNRPDLTAERFMADPFVPGSRMYRTGDVVKYLPDGVLLYIGRADFQVKVRGFRIELGEIETVLAQHPAVRECVAAVRDERLVAYFVTSPGSSPHPSELRAFLRERLPEYMTPVAFVELDRLPLTANGKVDRNALRAPEFIQTGGERTAPRTPSEEVLAGIWAEVLKVGAVGTADNFFEIGGHSLSATQVVARARAAFGVNLSVRALFESPTVAGLAQVIDRLERSKYQLEAPPLVRANRQRVMPLSPAQQRLWFLGQMEPESPLYNVPWAKRLTGAVDVGALESALNSIVQRHEVLRTIYLIEDDLPVQVILPKVIVPLAFRDLSGLPEELRESEARRIIHEESARPFDLAKDVLFRPLLVKLNEREHVLFVNMHHIACDGWSLGVLVSDLSVFYTAALSGSEAAIAPLPIQYADFAVWQLDWLRGEVMDRQLDYWKQRLEGAPSVLALPGDRERPETQSFRAATERAPVSKVLEDKIAALARQQGVTAYMTMLAAFQCMILYYTKQVDVVLGTDLAGRTATETEALIGFFVNLIVLRTDLGDDPTFSELLGRVREVTLGAYAHQDLPFDKIVEELKPERGSSINPLVQVLFVHWSTPPSPHALEGIELSGFPFELPSKFDLAVFCSDNGAGMTGTWIYNPDLFDRSRITRMTQQFQLALETAISNPQLRLSQIVEVLDENEQRLRLQEQKTLQETHRQKLKTVKRRTAGVPV